MPSPTASFLCFLFVLLHQAAGDMQFCPICSNILLVEPGQASFRFCCQTCPYVSSITRNISKTMKLKRKEVDDVLGGDEAWASANKTTANCQYCDNREVSD